ncbi:MAG: cytochrome c oxidase subunit II [Bacteroidia bacterium]
MKLLVILAVILFILAAHQLLKVVELVREMKPTKEWEPTDEENDWMGKMMLAFGIAFLALFFYQINRWYDKALPPAASEHGKHIDDLLFWNLILVSFIFVVVNALLFYFSYKYRGNKNRRAVYYADNSKLEMLWTVIPASALAFIITFGLKYWNEITAPSEDKNPVVVELYAKQFDWTARFPGKDGKLGSTDFRHIEGSNPVGLDTTDKAGFDDLLVKNEIHLPVGKEVVFHFRSRDVIHSAFMPHFRAQMNCVPGMVTSFKFKPTKTTKEMRQDPYVQNLMKQINERRAIEGKEPVEFDYTLLCNKICGASHYNMQMKIVVETEQEFNEWMRQQKAFKTLASK